MRRQESPRRCRVFKRQKLIDAGRNQIIVLNRKGFERLAGKAYGTPEREYRRLIG